MNLATIEKLEDNASAALNDVFDAQDRLKRLAEELDALMGALDNMADGKDSGPTNELIAQIGAVVDDTRATQEEVSNSMFSAARFLLTAYTEVSP